MTILPPQVRCISLLVLPHFFGKHGRAYVMTFALTLLITGKPAGANPRGVQAVRTPLVSLLV